jgi:NDP-sugar pyrophosphorylase family protein
MKKKYTNDQLNVIIPMAGAGSRFESEGYTLPKPLIDVMGQPMIKVVVDSLSIDANFIFVVQKKHRELYKIDETIKNITPRYSIIEVDGLTNGAACTVLKCKDLINNNNPLLIANSDQWIDWDVHDFFNEMVKNKADGGILTFKSESPKHSYVKIIDGLISEVAEKKVISNNATVGVYYWKTGESFVKSSEQMIDKNIRTNNEFYLCPSYNELILNGGKVINYETNEMIGMGTPEELNNFLKIKKEPHI